ncbi:leucine-rich repeat and IQ domain-containing protein 3-like isoform X3 [Sinocyclocheilus grahami]|uniref:leucine-rich repeat and IQ domain-containing protein 3-like isoform X3 n=1 Tax=Sinocyclocheilus grahami TaxID=75366 RepID=UPI0007ACFEA4|nr:PREDICTED: leucine-rich repeat and IQ domain-containing protein 3-like isoform X3 [Sinocyclocheilus grahami]
MVFKKMLGEASCISKRCCHSNFSLGIIRPTKESQAQNHENGRDTFHKDIKMDSLEGYWAYLVNCSRSLILDHGYWTSEGEKDLEDMLMVRLSSLLLKSLDQIGSCRALRICILADNFLTRIEALMECTHLVKLDLKGNQIVQLPDASCWSHLKELQLLYLHDNNMSTWNNIKGLLGCLNLTALTLSDTPLSLKKNYRHCLVNNIWSLKALDNFVISDEEIIQNWSLPFRFKAMKQHFCVSLYPSTKSNSFETEMKATYNIISEINRIQAFYSPTLIIQRWIRGHLIRKSLGLCSTKKQITSGKPFIPMPLRVEKDQVQSQSQKTMKEDTDDHPEQDAANVKSDDNQQHIKAPHNTPRLKSEAHLNIFDQDISVNVGPCNEEIEDGTFHVLGLKALVHQSESLSDMLWSHKAAGQDIREAISHFHTQSQSPAITPGQRLIGCCHDKISLTPFKVIERAHQAFEKTRMQRHLAEKVTERHIDREVAKGHRDIFREARRTEVHLRQERERVDMEKTLILQRAKLGQDIHHTRQKHAQFLEEKRMRIQEQEMVCCFSQQHNSLARAVLRYNTWKRGNQQ